MFVDTDVEGQRRNDLTDKHTQMFTSLLMTQVYFPINDTGLLSYHGHRFTFLSIQQVYFRIMDKGFLPINVNSDLHKQWVSLEPAEGRRRQRASIPGDSRSPWSPPAPWSRSDQWVVPWWTARLWPHCWSCGTRFHRVPCQYWGTHTPRWQTQPGGQRVNKTLF